MDGYELMARALRAQGVEVLAAFPMQNLIEAAATLGMRSIICRQERTGVNIADGFSRVSNGRRFGVFTMQSGPGAENAFAGVAQAFADSVPLLHLPGGEARSRHGVHPTFQAVRNYQHVTKWAAQINHGDDVPLMVRRAVTQLRHGRPGPVLLEMPRDVMAEQVSAEAAGDGDGAPVPGHRSAAAAEDVRDLITALLGAERPVICAGQGVLYSEATAELVTFAELAGVPVMTTLAGKSAFPEDHRLALGTGGLTRTLMVSRLLGEADFVLGIGTSFTRNVFTTPMPAGVTIGQVTNCGEDLGKDYPVAVGAVGDAKLVLAQLAEELRRQAGASADAGGGAGDAAAQRIAKVRTEFEAEWEPRFSSDEVPISPYRVFRELHNAVDVANTIITHDSGYPRDQLVPFWKPVTPRGYLGWGKSTQLGYGLGLAIGAKLAAPERQVINVMGDASFGMSGLDIETAARSNLPILTVVLNNGHMTGYDAHMPQASKRFGSNQLSGSYAHIATGLGAHSERVEAPGELAAAIGRALAANRDGQTALLEVMSKVEKDVPRA